MVESMNIDINTLTESANNKFTSLFIETGIKPKTEAFFRGNGYAGGQGVAQNWINGVWMMVYKAMWRGYVLAQIFFLPLLALGDRRGRGRLGSSCTQEVQVRDLQPRLLLFVDALGGVDERPVRVPAAGANLVVSHRTRRAAGGAGRRRLVLGSQLPDGHLIGYRQKGRAP